MQRKAKEDSGIERGSFRMRCEHDTITAIETSKLVSVGCKYLLPLEQLIAIFSLSLHETASKRPLAAFKQPGTSPILRCQQSFMLDKQLKSITCFASLNSDAFLGCNSLNAASGLSVTNKVSY